MLTSISVSGYRSIAQIEALPLNQVNVLIGPNGAGKSNFISVFRLLKQILDGDGLRRFVAFSGGANNLLHDGAEKTPEMTFQFKFASEEIPSYEYNFRLAYGLNDQFYFSKEGYRFSYKNNVLKDQSIEQGSSESELKNFILDHDAVPPVRMPQPTPDDERKFDSEYEVYLFESGAVRQIIQSVESIKIYQFQNTAVTAALRQTQQVDDTVVLRENGANIASMLLHLKEKFPRHYQRLVANLQLVWPQFAEFVLVPENNYMIFRWREKGSEQLFGAHQASDGTLRLLCLLFLLMQPKERRPQLLIIDEPELGLHPAAMRLLAGRIHSAAEEGTQIILATQSPTFLDACSPEDVIVLDRKGRATTAHRLSSERLKLWLEEYTLSEIWEKNIEGGNP